MCCDCPNQELLGIRQRALNTLQNFAIKLTKQREITASLLVREVITIAEKPGTSDVWTGLLNPDSQNKIIQQTGRELTSIIVKKLRSRLVQALQTLADAVLERWQKRRELTRLTRKTHNKEFQQKRAEDIRKRREDTAKKKKKSKKKPKKYREKDKSWIDGIPKPTPEELRKPRKQTKLTAFWTQSTNSRAPASSLSSGPCLYSPVPGAKVCAMENTASPSLSRPRKGVG
jgi:hypothetical protein